MVTQAQPVAAKEAPVELGLAQDKLARAEKALQSGDNEAARRLSEQAEADAKLAWVSAESARVQRAAAGVEKSVEALRDEVQRRKP